MSDLDLQTQRQSSPSGPFDQQRLESLEAEVLHLRRRLLRLEQADVRSGQPVSRRISSPRRCMSAQRASVSLS